MLFDSVAFFLFFGGVLGAYFRVVGRAQNALLLVASYAFYGWWDARFLILILISTATDFVAAQRIQDANTPRARKRWLVVSVMANLGLLAVFKYAGFVGRTINAALPTEIPVVDLVVPVGISFYTFQTMAYTIDVYRGRVRARRRFLDVALYVSFFPQLVAGPIERASHMFPQIESRRFVRTHQIADGLELVFWGLFRKVVIADNLAAMVVDPIFDPALAYQGGVTYLVGAYAFAIQIYCDFSGYSWIARGVAACFGFELSRNFRRPYAAASPREFWTRWHITLSQWLRDYLYIPLGGNRRHGARNLLVTMGLGGLWHGASWTFVIWGGYHGLLLVLHRLWMDRLAPRARVSRALRTIVTFHLICGGWLIFRAHDGAQLEHMIGVLMTDPFYLEDPHGTFVQTTLVFGLPLFFAEWIMKDALPSRRLPRFAQVIVYALAVQLYLLLGAFDAGKPFIYFQF